MTSPNEMFAAANAKSHDWVLRTIGSYSSREFWVQCRKCRKSARDVQEGNKLYPSCVASAKKAEVKEAKEVKAG